MALNPWLASAAGLVAALALFHSIMGERYIVRRLLRRDNLPRLFGGDSFTKMTIRYAWHLLTVLALGLALILYWAATADSNRDTQSVVGIVFWVLAAGGLLGLVATRGRHLSWIVLWLAALFAWIGGGLGINGQ